MNTQILSASTIKGSSVQNLEGKNIGDIQDLMIEPATGNVAYAVLSFGGFLGIGDKYFAIPIEALNFSSTDRKITLDVSKELLENAPGFDKDNWPMTADQNFIESVYNHYGTEMRDRSTMHRTSR
jgi:sporulation protein YlmC with PRC-barrel domain